jgi:DNA-binding GntR family transcriptional regulator
MSRTLEALMSIDDRIARELMSFGFGPAPDRVVEALGGCTEVLEIRRRSLAGDRTVGRNTHWANYSVTDAITVQLAETFPLHRLLRVPVSGVRQTITAEGASAEDAELLELPAGSPLLRFERTTFDLTGRPVLYSEAVYDPLRTELAIQLPVASAGDSWLTLRPVEVPGPAL